VSRTNKERVLDYLWSISPDRAANSQIREATGIKSHQVVYLLTRELMGARLIRGEQRGQGWIFWADESPVVQLASPGQAPMREVLTQAEKQLSPRAFEDLARSVMSAHFGVPLVSGQVPLTFQTLNQPDEAQADLTAAIQYARRGYEKNPQDWANTFDLALYHLVAGEAEGAGRLYKEALAGGASSYRIRDALYYLGHFLVLFPDHPQARAVRDLLQEHLQETEHSQSGLRMG